MPSFDLTKRTSDFYQSEFKRLALDLQTWARAVGVRLNAFHSPELVHFSKLNATMKKSALADLRALHQLWGSARAHGESLRDTKKLLWRFLSSIKWTPPSDLLDKINNDWAVEVFNPAGHQIFRNLKFLETFSFTLEQVMCTPWWELVSRPEKADQHLRAYAQSSLEGKIKHTCAMPSFPHICKEINSSESLNIYFNARYVAPLFQNSTSVGIVGISEAYVFDVT